MAASAVVLLRLAVLALSLTSQVESARLRASIQSRDRSNLKAQASAETSTATRSLAEVIDLLAQMLKELDEQAMQDKANWEKYSEWSDSSETEKNDFIQEQSALVMANEAKMSANKQQVAKLTADLGQLAADISETQNSLNELIKMRHEEHAAFEVGLADMIKTIKAVTKATEILEGHYAAGGAALSEIRKRVQLALTMYGVRSQYATQENVESLTSFLQGDSSNPDFLNSDGSKYDNYEKQGGGKGVVGMLTDLRSDLESQKEQLIAKESDSRKQYEATKAAKDTDLHNLKKRQAEKTAKKASCLATIEVCISSISESKSEIADAQGFLAELLSDRETFQKTYGDRVTMRSGEQAATQAALDALQAVSAGASSKPAGEMFFQTSMSTQAGSRLKMALKKLRSLGEEMKSTSLLQLASHLQGAHDSSFEPVIKLLNDLIVRLEEEAGAETTHQDWCNTEKETGVASKNTREKDIHELKGSIESLTTTIAQLKTEAVALMDEIARVEAETKAATEIRKTEHDLFTKSKAEHEEVIHAIETALEALSGQYGFIQLGSKEQETADDGMDPGFGEYKSGEGGAHSAIEMLQDLLERYSTALSEMSRDEEKAQKAYDELKDRNDAFVAETTNSLNNKISERRGNLNLLGDDKSEIKSNLIELHEVAKYLMDLRPSCDDIRSTFEERKKRREAEIAALKEALEYISDPSSME